MDDDDKMWTMAAGIAGVAAAALARKAIDKAWVKKRGNKPGDPLKGETSWREALAFAVVSGVTLGVVRIIAQRGVVAVHDKRQTTLASRITS